MKFCKLTIFITLLILAKSDIVEIEDLEVNTKLIQIPLNTVTNIKRFVYLNNTSTKNTTKKSGLNYSLTIKSTSNLTQQTNRFHIYLIKSDAIPHFDFINNPAVTKLG